MLPSLFFGMKSTSWIVEGSSSFLFSPFWHNEYINPAIRCLLNSVSAKSMASLNAALFDSLSNISNRYDKSNIGVLLSSSTRTWNKSASTNLV